MKLMKERDFLNSLDLRYENISDERKKELQALSSGINDAIKTNGQATVKFICTHNSRRSQAAEFLLDVLARKKSLPILSLSGGTEYTAFYPTMVEAIQTFGFEILKYRHDKNPLYIYRVKNNDLYYFSKVYNNDIIKVEDPIIVTVCHSAKENCPIIPGTYKRFHIGYEDPKYSDGSKEELDVYKKKVLEIGTEMAYLSSLISEN